MINFEGQGRKQKPIIQRNPYDQEEKEGAGPKRPSGDIPNVDKLLKRMKNIERDKAKKFKQGVGQQPY